MYRRLENGQNFWRKQLSPGHVRQILMFILTLIAVFLLLAIVRKSSNPFRSFFISSTISTVQTTTTTTESTTLKTTTKSTFQLGCFSSDTKVNQNDGSKKSIDSLKIGDEVLVYSENGQIKPSQILSMFKHYRSSVDLIEIFVEDQKDSLRLTSTHSMLVYRQTNIQYDFASNLKIGDFLLSAEFQPKRIERIHQIHGENQTIWTPLTFEGNVLVNDLIGSCYATFPHSFMHFLSWPLRYWNQINLLPSFDHFLSHTIDYVSDMSGL